jgi:hypothetical protein
VPFFSSGLATWAGFAYNSIENSLHFQEVSV